MPVQRKYLLRPSVPDFISGRPAKLASAPAESPFPDYVDLRPGWPDCYDQGGLGSCAANALAGMVQRLQRQQKQPDWMPSRLFLYYQARAMHGWQGYDSGMSLADGMAVLAGQGICPEAEWGYDEGKFAVRPPGQCYADALKERALMYSAIDSTDKEQIRACLNLDRAPVIGLSIYSSFEQGPVSLSGIVPMPDPSKDKLLGGHALVIVGYFTAGLMANHAGFPGAPESFICRNSWGAEPGAQGLLRAAGSIHLRSLPRVGLPSVGQGDLMTSSLLRSIGDRLCHDELAAMPRHGTVMELSRRLGVDRSTLARRIRAYQEHQKRIASKLTLEQFLEELERTRIAELLHLRWEAQLLRKLVAAGHK